jgi:hypothetical protein
LQSYNQNQMEILLQLEGFLLYYEYLIMLIVIEMMFAVRFATKRENHTKRDALYDCQVYYTCRS